MFNVFPSHDGIIFTVVLFVLSCFHAFMFSCSFLFISTYMDMCLDGCTYALSVGAWN